MMILKYLQSFMLSDVMKAVAVKEVFPAEGCERVDLLLVLLGRLAVAVRARVGDVVGQNGAAVFEQSFGFDLETKNNR